MANAFYILAGVVCLAAVAVVVYAVAAGIYRGIKGGSNNGGK